jgi:predicted CopG family antitoxin
MAVVYLNDEAFSRLRQNRRPGETYSAVVLEFVPTKAVALDRFLGICKGMDAKAAYARIKKERKRFWK